MVINQSTLFYEEKETLPGVHRVAEWVKNDFELVFGMKPQVYEDGSKRRYEKNDKTRNLIIYGTVGNSKILNALSEQGKIDLSTIEAKREVYLFQIVHSVMTEGDEAIIIAGGDKRGTIYGLLHLSEMLGVSPLVNWNHAWPAKKDGVLLTEDCNMVSKEPSVKYRGFFINDEWPAFGNWAVKHFGGVNAKCYERVFELLLRLKGNYLWPAMWDSNFNLDGPGLESAVLADELGVVMSTSHHEPCMRSGQEYGMVRGKDSIYGDAWDFVSNPDGISRFWRDGLVRNAPFENVITMGMRGENDTAIMQNASLEDNIQLVRNVIREQNRLIQENINHNLNEVPRQIVLFTEVEEFFYGNDKVKGLIGEPELDGVTLMLSDNNHGATRTLPSTMMRDHKGGYGMYYHMDMHGGPHSFQWIGSTYLPKVWEQMTAAYEYGVKDIWVTNVGDIGTQEYGLSYFLDLAYDIDKWGGTDAGITVTYTHEWVRRNFADCFDEEDNTRIERIIWNYTELLAKRQHEIMNEEIYHPVHYGEAQDILNTSQFILDECEELKKKCPANKKALFISLVYYPACGTANLMKLWIISGRNKLYAKQNRVEANELADMLPQIEAFDEALIREYMEIDDGYFWGFGLGEHIGFTTWCDEDNKYPLRTYVRPSNQSRMIVARTNDEQYLTGDVWRDRPQVWDDAMRPDVDSIEFDIARASREPIEFKISTDCEWLDFSQTSGKVESKVCIRLNINRERFSGIGTGEFTIENIDHTKAQIIVKAYNPEPNELEEGYHEHRGIVAIEAANYSDSKEVEDGKFSVLRPYGRSGSAIKVFPVTADFYGKENRPYVEYLFHVAEAGIYHIMFYMAATTPVVFERKQYIGYSVNEKNVYIQNTVEDEDHPFFLSTQWTRECYDNVKITSGKIECNKGKNVLRFYGMSPAIVLERIVIYRDGVELPQSYLGPKESYCVRY